MPSALGAIFFRLQTLILLTAFLMGTPKQTATAYLLLMAI
jgi:hypothetical protein